MSSPDQAPTPAPDDDDYSPEPAPPGSTPSPVDPTDPGPTQPTAAEPGPTESIATEPTADEPAAFEPYVPNPALDELVCSELARRTELIASQARVIAQAQARQAELLVDLQDWSEDPQVSARLHGNPESIRLADVNAATLTEDQARAAAFSRWDDREVARRTIVSETACLLRVAERTVERMMDQSLWLMSAPATFQALSAGEISYRHATVLVDQMRTLPDDAHAAFEDAVLPAAKTLPVGRFTEKARRFREKQHPESIVTRTKNALAERRSYWEAAQDGMGWLHWYGTAHDTKAAFDRINGMAEKLKTLDLDTAGDLPARTLDQLRADITAALLLDGITPTGMGAGVRGEVMVTVSVLTLLGLDEQPATLEGYGPISPDAAREIAGNCPGFTRILTHPETGVAVSVGHDQYRVTKGMKKWLRVRDETCRFPGCSRPAVTSDIDHTQEWQHGGGTDPANLAHHCEPHHRLKHLSRWSVKQQPGGVLLWTSPGERSYRTDPANPEGPTATRPTDHGTENPETGRHRHPPDAPPPADTASDTTSTREPAVLTLR